MSDGAGMSPSREKSAVIGVVLSMIGVSSLLLGSYLLPVPDQGRFFVALSLVVFGILLAASGVLVFVLPAAVEYWRDAMFFIPGSRTRF